MMKFVELSEQERKAVKEALEYIGYFDVAESPEMLQEWLDDGTIEVYNTKQFHEHYEIVED